MQRVLLTLPGGSRRFPGCSRRFLDFGRYWCDKKSDPRKTREIVESTPKNVEKTREMFFHFAVWLSFEQSNLMKGHCIQNAQHVQFAARVP